MYISWLSSHYAEVLFLLLLFGDSNESWHAGMGDAMQFCNLRYECISQIWGSLNLHPGIIPQATSTGPAIDRDKLHSNVNHLHLFTCIIYLSLCNLSALTVVIRLSFRRTRKKNNKTKPNSSYYIVTMTGFSCKVIFRISNQGLRTLLDFTNNMWTHPPPTRIWVFGIFVILTSPEVGMSINFCLPLESPHTIQL